MSQNARAYPFKCTYAWPKGTVLHCEVASMAI